MTEQQGRQRSQPQYPPQPPPKRSRTNLFVVIGLVLLLAVGGVVAVVVSAGDADTPHRKPGPQASSADTKLATARDAALADGAKAAETLTTLGADTIDADLDRWESVATGDLLTEIKSTRAAAAKAARDAGTTATSTVLSAALAELDVKSGTARLLVATEQDVTTKGGEPTKKRTRLSLSLVRTDDGWKAAAITTV